MIEHFPKFYFCRGGTSDRQFIERHLDVLPLDLQKIAADEYEHIYLHHFNRQEYGKARNEANDFLVAFIIDCNRQDQVKTTVDVKNKGDIGQLSEGIQRCKEAQRSRRKRIID